MLGFLLIAIFASLLSAIFGLAAAQTLGFVCLFLALLLLAGSLFEHTASA
jgi:hypothetical protein